MIKLLDVTKIYSKNGIKTKALDNISLEISRGEFVAITGRSGCGKSTLINLISALDSPSAGEIVIDTMNLNVLGDKEIAKFRNEKLGIVFQSYYLEETYTVYRNLQIPLMIKGVPASKHREIILPLLELVGMEENINKKANFLSGGEKQRVSIARAMVCSPEIILADEPCGNLDVENSGIVMDLLSSFADKGKTVVLVTHNLEDAKRASRIVTLEDGKVISDERR